VHEHEVERRPAAVDDHGLEYLAERAHRDEPGDRLILIERLAPNIWHEPIEEQQARSADNR
jgi:hypothetical protein